MAIWIIILVVILIAVGVGMFFWKKREEGFVKIMEERKVLLERINNASFANAKILQVDGGMMGEYSNKAGMHLTLNVLSENPYVAHTRWLIDITALDLLKVGNEISIKIDKEDPKRIYPSASWASFIS